MKISAKEFIDQNLRLYSAHSNVRGIPFIGDGFKQSHRKAVWGMLKRGESADKDTVERISARVASDTDYHHGVGSLESTIIGLAQDFAGSNNIPLFDKFGQFGDRLNKKPAASRYIKTKLGQHFRQIFKREDDILFEHIVSNGMQVEPKYFIPLLPLVLINGAEGMGTGHSTYILAHNPAEIRDAILKLLDGTAPAPHSLVPWWAGFSGSVTRDATTGQVTIEGVYSIKREGRVPTMTVTELPVGAQSDSYKAHLDKLEDREMLTEYDNLSDKNGFEFAIKLPRSAAMKSDEEIKKLFKLSSKESENLTVWNSDGVLTRYGCVEELLSDWVEWRLARVEDRRLALISKVKADAAWAQNKIKFIKFYLKNTAFFRDTATAALVARLESEGFSRHDELLSMPMRNLTRDKIADLEKDVEDLAAELERLCADNAKKIFKRELTELQLQGRDGTSSVPVGQRQRGRRSTAQQS
jgi:DNA topoisomerase-2